MNREFIRVWYRYPLVSGPLSLVISCVCILTACSPDRANRSVGEVWRADTTAWPSHFGFGREASNDEIAVWDIDVRPDGLGLPEGRGTVLQGKKLYQTRCARCHGAAGWGGPYMALVEHAVPDAGAEARTEKTIGSYWPYATTLYDYIHRAMPYDSAGILSPDEVYSLTAWLLYANRIIDSTTVITAEALPRVAMPAQPRFIPDDRRGGAEVR